MQPQVCFNLTILTWFHSNSGDTWRNIGGGGVSLDSSHFQYSELYPNLLKVFAISKTLPVSTATVERSFSAMNRILSWARYSLDSSLASDFMLLSMNKDIFKRLNLDKVLNRWVNQKERVAPSN